MILRERFVFNDRVKKIVFAREPKYWSPKEGITGQVVGWGKVASGNLSEQLQYVDLDIVECSLQEMNPGKFCAFGRQEQATCPGDSGGGFVILVNGAPTLIGVTSTSTRKASSSLPACGPQIVSFNHFKSYSSLFNDAKRYLSVSLFHRFIRAFFILYTQNRSSKRVLGKPWSN